jgi:hypothetical protein
MADAKQPFRSPGFWYVLRTNEMNAIMPRFGYDLRQPDLPPRWDASADADQSSPNNIGSRKPVGKSLDGFAGRVLTIAVSSAILSVVVFLVGAGLQFW